MRVILIAALTKNRVIGRDGGIPWHLPEDLNHFRQTTIGNALIIGRKTFESCGRPLPGRRNIVVTRNPDYRPPGEANDPEPRRDDGTSLDVVRSLDDALDLCHRRGEDEVFVAGGGELYAVALPLADEMILSHVDVEVPDGDAFFPSWNPEEWIAGRPDPRSGFSVVRYVRKR